MYIWKGIDLEQIYKSRLLKILKVISIILRGLAFM